MDISALGFLNKAGYTAKKQSLAGGQGQYTEGQGQSISGQGLYFGWAGAVMLRVN